MRTSSGLIIDAPDAAALADTAAFAAMLEPAIVPDAESPVLVVAPRGHPIPPLLDTAIAIVPPGYAARDDRGIRVIAAGFDGGKESAAAVAAASALAALLGATLRVYAYVGAAEPPEGTAGPPRTFGRSLRERLEHDLQEVLAAIPESVRPLGRVAIGGPVEQLVARSGEVDLLVLGTHRRKWLERALFGSVARAVVRRAECPVIVLPGGAAAPFAEALLGSG